MSDIEGRSRLESVEGAKIQTHMASVSQARVDRRRNRDALQDIHEDRSIDSIGDDPLGVLDRNATGIVSLGDENGCI